ncbi:MAG: CPBP family intramembrane metalloprotease [Lysobacterales bacterium]
MTAPMFTQSISALLPQIGFMAALGPMEEIGWRGYALPILQRKFVPFWAGLALGLIWAVWHLPAFMLNGTPQAAWGFMPLLAGSVASSVILTALFNAAGEIGTEKSGHPHFLATISGCPTNSTTNSKSPGTLAPQAGTGRSAAGVMGWPVFPTAARLPQMFYN